jgi:hypothetical protein
MGHFREKMTACGDDLAAPQTVELFAPQLFLPGALLVTVQAQLFTTFVFVNFCLTAFFK